jgi:hypothetical protein
MELTDRLDLITSALDDIWDKYECLPDFSHPLYPERSPKKHYWPNIFETGEFYYWKISFDVGDTKDTSGLLLKYYSTSGLYNIIFGKDPKSVDRTTIFLDEVLELFEQCLREDIIAGRQPA